MLQAGCVRRLVSRWVPIHHYLVRWIWIAFLEYILDITSLIKSLRLQNIYLILQTIGKKVKIKLKNRIILATSFLNDVFTENMIAAFLDYNHKNRVYSRMKKRAFWRTALPSCLDKFMFLFLGSVFVERPCHLKNWTAAKGLSRI